MHRMYACYSMCTLALVPLSKLMNLITCYTCADKNAFGGVLTYNIHMVKTLILVLTALE